MSSEITSAFTVFALLGCAAVNMDSECTSQIGHAPPDGALIRALHALTVSLSSLVLGV